MIKGPFDHPWQCAGYKHVLIQGRHRLSQVKGQQMLVYKGGHKMQGNSGWSDSIPGEHR